MAKRLAFAIGLAVLIIALASAIEIHAAMARPTNGPDSCGSTQYGGCGDILMISNIQAVEEGPYNLTFSVKHRFLMDYSNGPLDFSGAASDKTDGLGTPTVPEFPSFPIMLLFMATSLIGVTLFKMRVKRSSLV